MLTKLLHKIAAYPIVYDSIQRLAGVKEVHRRLSAHINYLLSNAFVVDIGGGTGLIQSILPPDVTYCCLDIDPVKILGFLAKESFGVPLLASGAQIPLAENSVDGIICTSVSHHFEEELLISFFKESARVLKPEGKFIFEDGLWVPHNKIGRLLWYYDRGSNPRTEKQLHSLIKENFEITHWETFDIYHSYVICTGKPIQS